MAASPGPSLLEHFAGLADPRMERTKLHPLLSIVAIAICAVIAGAESWDDIELFGKTKADWFGSFLALPHGIPSHDTFNRVFAALDPDHFRAGFASWIAAITTILPAQGIALDGKTVRRSHDRHAGKAAIHMVSAWATTNRLVLAQVKVDEKSNEITALPILLRQLALTGCIVTIDAMGCQRGIAQQIVDQGADYILALQGNQGTLAAEVAESFTAAERANWAEVVHDQAQTIDKGHGRIEVRQHWVLTDPPTVAWVQAKHAWPGLTALGMIEAARRVGEKRSTETRYYLLSRSLTAQAFGEAVRNHWGIENRVHWLLDVVFREDDSRIRAGHAAENVAVLRHIALNLLRHQEAPRLSLKAKRLRAGWDTDFLLQVLHGN